jgi:predicted nucleic acid-binding protein
MKPNVEPRLIVTNTGPLLHLIEAEALDILATSGSFYAPASVFAELKRHLPQAHLPGWIRVGMLSEHFAQQAERWQQANLLDRGEADAIALARQLNADWFLTDDAAARLMAQTLELEVHGSLGIILWAAVAGVLDYSQAHEILERLKCSSLWISAKVFSEALAALEQICEKQGDSQ